MFRSGASSSSRGGNSKSGVEATTARVAPPEIRIPIVRVKLQPRVHKVIGFGYMVSVPEDDGEGGFRRVVPDVYKFQYPPVPECPDDLVPGVIPAQFQACIELDNKNIFLDTQEGDNGPEYRYCSRGKGEAI